MAKFFQRFFRSLCSIALIFACGSVPWNVYAAEWSFSSASYTGTSFSYGAQTAWAWGMFFKSDGTKLYMADFSGNRIYQYSLSTAWDLTTASYDSKFVSTSSQGSPNDVYFKDDGTKMYVSTFYNETVYQYSLSTAWDVSTATYDSVSFSYTSQDLRVYGTTFKTDGSKFYVLGDYYRKVFQYTLSTPWDLSTTSYANKSYTISQGSSEFHGIAFRTDGTKMYLVSDGTNTIYQYSLSTAWDVTTASYDSVSFSVGSQDATPWNLSFKSDGVYAYVMGSVSEKIYEYILGDVTAPTITSVSSDTADGSYNTGDTIDIDVTFSEAVTSTGNVTVTLETGDVDRTCTFTISSSTTGTCTYTVQAGDSSSDLTTSSISGTIADSSSNAMTNFTPTTNLAANKALVVDAISPVLTETTPITTPTEDTTPIYVFTSDEAGTITYGGSCSSSTTSASVGANAITFANLLSGTYSDCTIIVTDSLGNASTALAVTAFTVGLPASGGDGGVGKGGEPASLPDPVKVATTSSGNSLAQNTQTLTVRSGDTFTLRVKAPDADAVKSVTVKINGATHVFTLEQVQDNPVFLRDLALTRPGKYPYTVVVDYGFTEKRSSGVVVVRGVPSQLPTPVSPVRLVAQPRTSEPVSTPSPRVSEQEPSQSVPVPTPVEPTASVAPVLEERVLDIQISTLLQRAVEGPRSIIARVIVSTKSAASALVDAPKRLWLRIAQRFQEQRYDRVTIRLASANGKPLVGAKVVMHSEPRSGVTDETGQVEFRDVERGKHQLDIEYQEYRSKQEVVLSHDVSEVTINIIAEFRKE